MRLVGVASSHRPWWGPKPLVTMVETGFLNNYVAEVVFGPGTFLRRIPKSHHKNCLANAMGNFLLRGAGLCMQPY